MRSPGGKPQPGSGATNPNVGSIQRPDGSNQITFNGHPLYYYSGDTGPGQTAGQGRSAFGGQWSASPPTKP
jgi:predicted lipoprotein with Yx(FWY)xxD motif